MTLFLCFEGGKISTPSREKVPREKGRRGCPFKKRGKKVSAWKRGCRGIGKEKK